MVSTTLQAFDALAILLCGLSCLLCVRSVLKSIKLAKVRCFYFWINSLSNEWMNQFLPLKFLKNTCCIIHYISFLSSSDAREIFSFQKACKSSLARNLKFKFLLRLSLTPSRRITRVFITVNNYSIQWSKT